MKLDDLSDEDFAEYALKRAMNSPVIASRLTAGLAGIFAQVASPVAAIALPANPEPPLALPAEAPRLWRNRPEGRAINPAQFIRTVYAPWIDRGLTRQHVGQLDDALGKAYSQWIRPERHPEDAISFAEGNPYGRLDDAEAIKRHRASVQNARAKAKVAAEADKMTHRHP